VTVEEETLVTIARLLEQLEIPHDALRRRLQFNAVDRQSAFKIDRGYIEKWAAALGVLHLWREIGE
jgi:hypothetical protein